MRRPQNAVPALLLAALAASCDDPAPRSYSPQVGPGPGTSAKPAPSPGEKRATPPAKKMPEMPPLTEATAKAVFASQVAALDADDASREALLYLADLGDRSCLAAVRERLLARNEKGYTGLTAAALGAEALLAFGEKDAASVALAVAKQYASEEEDADEYLLHALARVQGAERGEALKSLIEAAESEDPNLVPLAVQLLAASSATEARDVLDRIARDAEQDAQVRGAAAAGLLHLKDPKAAELAESLVRAATNEKGEEQLDAADLMVGFGVEGVAESSPYVRKLVDASLAVNDAGATFVMTELATALGAIYRTSGGAELVPWLREIGKRNDDEYSDETALAMWTLGDDSHAATVAQQLEAMVAQYAVVNGLEDAVEILDVAARRGVAAKEPFRRIVDSAAQIQPPSGAVAANGHVRALNLAAAHAFLKSSK
jgi:hypothetical protein